MKIHNFVRKDVRTASAASTDIKNVSRLSTLSMNVNSNRRNNTYAGLGSYLEVDIEKKGARNTVKIPFFIPYTNSRFVDINGYAYVSPLAKKVIRRALRNANPAFDLATFQADTTTEINARIAALPAGSPERTKLENRRDNVIANAKKKDSDKLARQEIKYLESVIKGGVNLRACTNETSRKAAITKYANQFERLMTLKEQVKGFTWSQKKWFRKLNNKYFRRTTAGALVVALGLAIGEVIVFPKNFIKSIGNWFKPKATVTQEVKDKDVQTKGSAATETIKVEPKATAKPVVTAEPKKEISNSVYKNTSEMLEEAYIANQSNFIYLKQFANEYGINYEEAVKGYTFVEHIESIDTTRFTEAEINNYINNARTFVSVAINRGGFSMLPIGDEAANAVISSAKGDASHAIAFVQNAIENNRRLLDMIAAGESVTLVLRGEEFSVFIERDYYPELNGFKEKAINGTLTISQVKTLGVYPIA